MIDYKGRLLKLQNWKLKLVLSAWALVTTVHGFQTLHFICYRFGCKLWLWLIQNHARHRFQAFARAHTQPSEVAVLFASNLSRKPFLRQVVDLDLLLCTLHRIQFGTCCFIPMSYFHSETNGWSKKWVNWWALLWLATTSRQFNRKFHFRWKQMNRSSPILTKHKNLFDSLSQYRKSGSTFSSSEPVACSSNWWRFGNALCLCLLVRRRLISPSCAGALPHRLGDWFCSQKLWLSWMSSGIWNSPLE